MVHGIIRLILRGNGQMAIERSYTKIDATPFTADGLDIGLVTIADTACYKVKMIVVVKADTMVDQRFEVKRVISDTQMYLGPENTPLRQRIDMSPYVLGLNPTIEAPEQERPHIPPADYERAVYEEEPTVAKRVIPVDKYGKHHTVENPFPVRISDGSINIGTVNAELEVQLSHIDNNPDAGDIADSVQIGDGVETLEINPDGSINIMITGGNGDVSNIFNEINSLASLAISDIVSYVVPEGKTAILDRIEFSGNNIAIYEVEINSTIEARNRTWFGGDLSGVFEFRSSNSSGIPLSAGDEVVLRVNNFRPSVGDFEGRIQVLEL